MTKQRSPGAGSEDEPLQAVVIADNFNDNFTPVVPEVPFALLPLVGVPFVDYALESLAQSGVNETFLFCSSRADLIKAHIQKSREEKAAWSASMTVHIIVSESCRSFGDALRDLDAKSLVNGYFILMGADAISNVKLLPLLEKHKEISKRDKGAAMTLLFKPAVPGHRAQSVSDSVLLAADTNTNRVLLHQKLPKKDGPTKVSFPIEIFLGFGEVEIHNDLLDTHIAICSPSVLPLFADNFDFQTRDDFVKGILMNEEILASTIYWHKLEGDQYAARVTDWQMYQTVSQDIMHRWVFPLVPDMGISKQENNYMLLRNHVYRHRDVTLAKKCTLEEYVVIALGSIVGENTVITRSVIGKNCKIGSDVHISDSYIMDGCTVNANCHIVASVLGSKCTLDTKVDLNAVILGSGVKLNKNEKLEKALVQQKPTSSSKKIGEKAHKLEFDKGNDNESIDSDASDTEKADMPLLTVSNNWNDNKSECYASSSEEETSRSASPVQEDTNLFLHEVIDSLARGFEEKLKCDYLILEINSSRYAYNMSLQEVNFYVVRALFSLPPMATTTNIVVTFKELFNYFTPIIANYIKGNDAMMDCLRAIEESCENNEALIQRVGQVLHFLYEKDVITEEIIMKWYEDVDEESVLNNNVVLKKFIEWLNQSSEEESD